MVTLRQRIAGDHPPEVGKALDKLIGLIVDVASDERRLSDLAARLTDLDMDDLGLPQVGSHYQALEPAAGASS